MSLGKVDPFGGNVMGKQVADDVSDAAKNTIEFKDTGKAFPTVESIQKGMQLSSNPVLSSELDSSRITAVEALRDTVRGTLVRTILTYQNMEYMQLLKYVDVIDKSVQFANISEHEAELKKLTEISVEQLVSYDVTQLANIVLTYSSALQKNIDIINVLLRRI